MTDLSCVDTEELGEVIDMIKDLAKAIYYCQVVSAMEEEPSKKKDIWTEQTHTNDWSTSGNNQTDIHNDWEGRSPMRRKKYMENKSHGHTNSTTMQELEGYMQDLTSDMTELVKQASPEEKVLYRKK